MPSDQDNLTSRRLASSKVSPGSNISTVSLNRIGRPVQGNGPSIAAAGAAYPLEITRTLFKLVSVLLP